MTACEPSSTALVMAMVMPRSLNDPVGLAPSTFSHTSHPVRRDSLRPGTTGVAAPRNVATGAVSGDGHRDPQAPLRPGPPGDTRPPAVVTAGPPPAARRG